MTNKSEKKSFNLDFFQKNIAFFVCLLFAIIVWIGIKMSEPLLYVHQTFDIHYNLDQAYDFVHPPPSTINFTKTGTGWSLLASRMSSSDKHITIETIPELRQQFVQRAELIQLIAAEINSPDVRIDQLGVDAIILDYELRKKKQVPIRLVGNVDAGAGYILTKPATLIPDSIWISGAQSILDTISSWPTLTIGNLVVKDKYKQVIKLRETENLILSIESTELRCTAEQITERKLIIPISSDQENIRLVPDEVEVLFNTGISQFNTISPDQFSFIARIDTTQNQLNKNAPVILDRYPGHIINIRFQPKVVEYLYN